MTSLAPHIDVEFLNVFNKDTHNLIRIDVEVKAHSNPGTQTGKTEYHFWQATKQKSSHASRTTIQEQVQNADSCLDQTEVVTRPSMNLTSDTVDMSCYCV